MKLLVDASDERGRVVLTGSQGYRLMHGVSESLAGCEGIPDLSGISLREELGMCGGGAYIPGASGPAKVARPENIRGRIWRGHAGGRDRNGRLGNLLRKLRENLPRA